MVHLLLQTSIYNLPFSFRGPQPNVMKKCELLLGCTWEQITKLNNLYLLMKQG